MLTATLARFGLRAAYLPFRLVPRRHKVTILSRQSDTPTDDIVALAAALVEVDPDLEVVVLTKMLGAGLPAKVRYGFHLLAQMPHIASSSVLVLDTYSILASVLSHPPGLTIVQMWHALGAFKKFGLAATGTALAPKAELAATMKQHENYDWVIASGPACIRPYAEAFGVREDQVVLAPLPRVDLLADPSWRESMRAELLRRHPRLRDARVALFAPTFTRGAQTTPMDAVGDRSGSAADEPLDDSAEIAQLARALAAQGFALVLSRHPLDRGATPEGVVSDLSVSSIEWLTVADVVMTDYSSIVFEAALLGRPLVRFLRPSLDRLPADAFFLDWDRDVPGPVCDTAEQAAHAVTTGLDQSAELARFRERFVFVPAQGTASSHLAALIAGWVTA